MSTGTLMADPAAGRVACEPRTACGIAANPGHIPPTDFGHADQLISRALAAARTPSPPGRPTRSLSRLGSLPPSGLEEQPEGDATVRSG